MNKTLRFLAVPTLALGALALSGGPASAADHTYQSTLSQINGSSASGTVTVDVTGNQAHAVLKVSGLAPTFNNAPYPHVQHIHGGAQGMCPAPSADKDGDGVVSTTEGAPSYGGIVTTLSTSGDTSPAAGLDLKLAGQGASYTVDRTFELNAETKAALEAGTAVVVVHGLDPATLSPAGQAAKSDLVPSLPLAATSPALCGTLKAGQMKMPAGGADTGVAQQASGTDSGVLALGGGLVLAAAAGGAYLVRRRGSGSAA
ncbi:MULTISPECIES: CHRD domain-containing protein [unclassified Arthrobacter]|uniref:CHRD domain-containing protein n=1 Tax=unclassified Arthrobacter TaxID=235627 RepID=UPI001C846EB1|nr:CHRD domain-containing protein [Arthrobacter sp. MAHUQ-56]MBX7444831.1 CHRD domain-containing protein [Arthrobacter sp. MAHUQ-56]